MERAAAGDVGGGLPLNKAQQRSHMRKCLKEKVETPGRESVSQPGTTAKEPSKEASVLKPEPCRNKVKDLEEHVLLVMILQTFIRTWHLLSGLGSQKSFKLRW